MKQTKLTTSKAMLWLRIKFILLLKTKVILSLNLKFFHWIASISHTISNFHFITGLFFQSAAGRKKATKAGARRGLNPVRKGSSGEISWGSTRQNHLRSYSLAKIISFSQARCIATNHHIILARWRENTRCGKIYVEKNVWFTNTCFERNWK